MYSNRILSRQDRYNLVLLIKVDNYFKSFKMSERERESDGESVAIIRYFLLSWCSGSGSLKWIILGQQTPVAGLLTIYYDICLCYIVRYCLNILSDKNTQQQPSSSDIIYRYNLQPGFQVLLFHTTHNNPIIRSDQNSNSTILITFIGVSMK